MIDIKAFRHDPATFEKAAKDKNIEIDGNHILSLDKKVRDLRASLEEIASQKNNASKEIVVSEGDERERLISEMRDLDNKAARLKEELEPIDIELQTALYQIPNPALDDVPIGKDESENVVVSKHGEPKSFDFEPKDHVELGKLLNIIDSEKAADVSGSRFTYLKNGAALIQFALIQFVLKTLTDRETLAKIAKNADLNISDKPFEFVIPPVMIRPDVYQRMARLSADVEDERYYLQKDNLYLIGSAEHTLGPLHMDEILDEGSLPRRYLGYSTSFRREAGSYGKDTKGIIRQHQFDKLEMESFTTEEHAKDEQDFLVAIQEYLLQELGLPYQRVMVCTGDMGKPDARQIDIETWIPTQECYRETHSADLMGDYQSRRLKARYKIKDGTKLLHMNDATVFAIGRILVAILENNQNEDGSVNIPDALHPYMHGLTKLEPKS